MLHSRKGYFLETEPVIKRSYNALNELKKGGQLFSSPAYLVKLPQQWVISLLLTVANGLCG